MAIHHHNAQERTYRLFCLFVFGIWFVYILLDPLTSLAQYPKSLYFPAGFLLKFLPADIFYLPVSYPFLLFLKTGMLLSIALVLLGKAKKWAALAACLFLTVYESLVRSFGHINHPEMPLLLTVYVLTIFFFFEGSLDAAKLPMSKYGIPLVAVLFIFCFTYCLAGIHRMTDRGLSIYGTNTITFWIIEEGKRSRMVNWRLEDLVLTNPLIGVPIKLGFPLVSFFEITAPFCIICRPFRWIWLAVMLPFHIIVWLFMGIFFWANMALYVLLLDFPAISSNPKTGHDH